MPQFGFSISQPRAVNLDTNDLVPAEKILHDMPELQTCIACGSCTATCTAGNLTSFNFRKVHTLVRRGEYRGLTNKWTSACSAANAGWCVLAASIRGPW